ncbi:MAG TPA: hypothetical protein VFQ70_01540, partial [Candidatus Saccharimonadaceae bacterium]|nr:hypothetical protein [Candidatus Saccharimonadaceae bacterium]
MGKRTQLASVARLDALGARGSLGRTFDIADIAGVIADVKPAAIVAPALSFRNKKDRVAYERVLEQLGLESLPVDDTTGWNAIIAKDSTILEELRRAVVAVDALFQKSIAA